MAASPRRIEVALPLPLFRSFTYELPDTIGAPIAPGARVVVPLRRGREIGICVGGEVAVDADAVEPAHEIRQILGAPDVAPAITASLLGLARWISEYYIVPLGVVLRGMLPALLAGASAPAPAGATQRVIALTRELPSLIERDQLFARARRQRDVVELLETSGGRAPVATLLRQMGISRPVLDKLVARGIAEFIEEPRVRDPFASRAVAGGAAHRPVPAQRAAIDAIAAGKGGDVFLLHGVTGSGKTLVYIEALRRVVMEQRRSAIVLVPEIALTPQTVDRFRAAFGDQVAVLHSALSDGERLDAWRSLRSGARRIAVGARSAVFAPLENVGAIIVDEEHESSYKQGESPRYHAREVAIVRARLEGAVTVLGSATPSLESWHAAAQGRFHLLSLPDRVGGGRLPSIAIVNLARKDGVAPPRTESGAPPPSVLSEPLRHALHVRLERGEQALLLLNRRGFSAFMQCGACGNVSVCSQCSISLTYHRAPERLVCHYCLKQEPVDTPCSQCGGLTMRRRGVGTQQVERVLADEYPSARIARMDFDTTSGKWAHAEILDRVGSREIDILLGTQMVAKGLDFPNVTLVGVLDADVGVNLPDFRASERCFQLLSQVAGRAGRGPKGGEVLIQTRLPQHHAVRCAVAHDYRGFVEEEMTHRVEVRYPPVNRLVNVVFSAATEKGAAELAESGAAWLRRLIASRASGMIDVIGAAPCPVERIKTHWRWHVLLKSEHVAEVTRVGKYFLERFAAPRAAKGRVVLDRDPVSLM